MNYPDSVHFLYALGNEMKTAKFGLERIRTVMAALGNPQDRCRFVHVAGTNGKGSVCAMIESGLRAAGHRTGLFISPHLVEPTERISTGGKPADAAAFAGAFNRVHEAVDRLLASGAIDFHTTYFETVVAMAFLLFAEAGAEIVVLETGLGGRLDATNIVHPALTVITPVDMDHEAWLGNTIESIAGEKAGILKAGVGAVFAPQRPDAQPVLDHRAQELGVPVKRAGDMAIANLSLDARGSSFELGPLHIRCPLAGAHQVDNTRTAVAALQALGVPPKAIEEGIANAQWPGRLERVSESPEIILDGAHNPAGARALAEYIRQFYSGRNVRMIFAAMRDKAVEEVCQILFPLAAEVITTAPGQARALEPTAILDLCPHPNAKATANLGEALALVSDAKPQDVILITGSLYLVGEARGAGLRPGRK